MTTFDLFGHELRKLIGQWHRDGRNDPHELALALAVEAYEMAKRVRPSPAFHGSVEELNRSRLGWTKPSKLVDLPADSLAQFVDRKKGDGEEPEVQ